MKTFEDQLSEISRKQGIAVNEIVSLCKENEEILARQKVRLIGLARFSNHCNCNNASITLRKT
jgi:hypothetical protein